MLERKEGLSQFNTYWEFVLQGLLSETYRIAGDDSSILGYPEDVHVSECWNTSDGTLGRVSVLKKSKTKYWTSQPTKIGPEIAKYTVIGTKSGTIHRLINT